jgi:hypothetical protein
MLAGISGATPGSGAAVGSEENDGRLKPPPHAPSNSASAEAIPRLPTARALTDLTMAFPRTNIRGRTRPAANRKTPVGAMTSHKIRQRTDMVSRSSYISLTNGLTPLLDRIGPKPYSGRTIWHSNLEIAKDASRPAPAEPNTPRIPSHFRWQDRPENRASKRNRHG